MPMPSGTPALLTRMSIGPCSATAAATASPSVTSKAAATAPSTDAGHRVGPVGVEVVDHDRGPVVGQGPDDADPDALARAGDEGPLAGEVEGGHVSRSLRPAGLVPPTIDSARAVTIGFSSSWGRIQSVPVRMASTTRSATTDGSMPVPASIAWWNCWMSSASCSDAAEAVGPVALGLEDPGLDQAGAEDADAHAGALELQEQGLGEGDDAVLGHAVRAEGGHGQDPRAGGRVDDVAVALLDHAGAVEPGQVDDLEEVDARAASPRSPCPCPARVRPGPTPALGQRTWTTGTLRARASSASVSVTSTTWASPPRSAAACSSAGLVDVDQHELHALGREPLGHGPADAAGRAGDERGLALEGVHVGLSRQRTATGPR